MTRFLALAVWLLVAVLPAMAATAVSHPEVVEIRSALFVMSDAPTLPDPLAAWQPQGLPDSWRESRPGQQGYGWYRAEFSLSARPQGMHAIYISLVNSAYAVFINGVQVGDSGGMTGQVGRNGGFPQWLTVPPEILREGANEFSLRLRVAPNLRGGLSPPFIGPQAAVEALHGSDDLWRVIVPRALNTAVLALGLLALLLWSRHRSESVYGWFGAFLVLSALWALRNFHQSVTLPDIPSRAWETFVLAGHAVGRLALLMFVLRYTGQQRPQLERVVVWAMPVLPLLLFATGEAFMSQIRSAFYAATALPMWYSIYLLARYSGWRSDHGARLVLAALLGSEVLAIHDWMIAVNRLPFGTVQWQAYGAALLMTAMTGALAGRYFAAFATARFLNRELEHRVAQKTRELDDNYRKVAAYEQAAALEEERRRLMRDMHDGIGSQLITTASAVERGQLSPAEIASLLRDCMDDLRLVIDSLEPGHSDLALALASLRYRLAPRLQAAGLASDWALEGIPPNVVLAPTQVLQILRIVQEALSNVVRHAGASHAALEAIADKAGIHIGVRDNGHGLVKRLGRDAAAASGRGLENMRYRAAQLGGTVRVNFSPEGTEVLFTLPASRLPA
ncbi:MAG: 7TM diverse intracellular signaling domain-containing protein [Polaromonas sp.]|nr:7TM diverse intracellular signaling domain-containing protein [Polaromonas sp.]